MNKRTWLWCALAMLAVGVSATAVMADDGPSADPGQIARRCMSQVNKMAAQAVKANATDAAAAIKKIVKLKKEGHYEAAKVVADRAIAEIARQTRQANEEITQRSERCAKVLRKMGANRLAAVVFRHGQRKVKQVGQSGVRNLRRIRKVLAA